MQDSTTPDTILPSREQAPATPWRPVSGGRKRGRLEENPERLVSASDLARLGLLRSYTTVYRWVVSGRLPRPYRPGGHRMLWRAGDVLAAIKPPANTAA